MLTDWPLIVLFDPLQIPGLMVTKNCNEYHKYLAILCATANIWLSVFGGELWERPTIVDKNRPSWPDLSLPSLQHWETIWPLPPSPAPTSLISLVLSGFDSTRSKRGLTDRLSVKTWLDSGGFLNVHEKWSILIKTKYVRPCLPCGLKLIIV